MWQVKFGPQLKRTGRLGGYVALGVSLCLPLVLALHAFYSRRELREMRTIFLRDRAADVAAQLEQMAPELLRGNEFESLLYSNPALVAVEVFPPEAASAGIPAVAAIRSGRELYRTEEAGSGANAVFRAYIPFHSQGRIYVSRVDLALTAPDFILKHARQNTLVAIVSGSALLVISLFALWALRRASKLERRQLETERLAEIGRLSANLAHEIRNPLGAIKGFAQLARENAEPGRAKPLDAIIRESKRLEGLVESLLLYGRPAKPDIVATEWGVIAGDLEAAARALIGGRDIRFRIESQLKRFSTDGNILKQALLNLIRNSIEAIPPNAPGEVRVTAAQGRGGALSIAVDDTGPGIPAEVRARLFSPFVTSKASGTGLGLSIARKMVEALGGELRLLDLEPHGTRAEVELYGTNPGN